MGYQIYQVGKRWGGYGVPTICEQPSCTKRIDRGISFACGNEPFSEWGCDLYFCEKHRHYTCVLFLEDSEHDCYENENDCEFVMLCNRCKKGKEQFDYKPEKKEWVKHLLTDESWEEWRNNNPLEVEELTNSPQRH